MTRAVGAPLAGGDPTRAHALEADGRTLLPGLTRPEAEAASRWLADVPPRDRRLVLVEVVLPVVLTDGAGPHLLDASGSLVLALGTHAHLVGARVAMGALTASDGDTTNRVDTPHIVGAVRPMPAGGWLWLARAVVAAVDRVPALDGVDAAHEEAALRTWADRWAGAVPTLAP